MHIGSMVEGINMDDKNIKGKLESVAGFGMVGMVRTGKDRLDITYAYIEKLKEIESDKQ
jgi:hypothetical protein